jgi:Fe-S cluster assembly iron-binding protein IscA
MLTVTKDAATLIRSLSLKADRNGRPGLRIVVDPDHHSLSMSLADGPSSTDDVVQDGVARVFLSPSASRRLDKRTLRAATSDSRSSFFLD